MSDTIEDAKKCAREEVCADCSSMDCCNEDICDGFQDVVKEILAEWKNEE